MYSIRTYVKTNGTVGYELYNSITDEAIQRDDDQAFLRQIAQQLTTESIRQDRSRSMGVARG